jgi:hypothetical protein
MSYPTHRCWSEHTHGNALKGLNPMARRIVIAFSTTLFLLTLCSSLLSAQSNRIDFQLSGKYEAGKTTLKWTTPPGDSTRYYLVYRGPSIGLSPFVRIDSTTKTESIDQPPAAVNQPFLYYVIAVTKNGAMRYSNVLSIGAADVIRISSKPVETATLNVQYSYQVTATTTDPVALLKYQLSSKPDNMSIDSVTGVLKWIPGQIGVFKVVVLVTSTRGGRAEQGFAVTVSGPTGVVAGTVTDSLGNRVAGTSVLLYRKNVLQLSEIRGVTDSLGRYTIPRVDTGTYVARALPNRSDLVEQWYNGAASADKATAFAVKSNVTATIDFKLGIKSDLVRITSKPPESGSVGVLYTYQVTATTSSSAAKLKYALSDKPSGMTIDSASGLVKWVPAQKGAFKAIVFVTSSKGGQAEQGFAVTVFGPMGTVAGVVTDSLRKPLPGVIIRLYQKNVIQVTEIKGVTDSVGKYTISRVDTGTYVARATATNSVYLEQWYDGKPNVENATPFSVKANATMTVDFKLSLRNDEVRISSKPAEAATVNLLYSYQVIATSTDPSAKLKYQLTSKPTGMTIDSVAGIVKWVPTEKGVFKISLLVVSSRGGRAEQSFAVSVGNPTGTVAGVVTDTVARPIAGVTIRLYRIDVIQYTEVKCVTDSLGKYTVSRVDSGRYIARATPSRSDFMEQWYSGAESPDNATAFVVTPTSVAIVNFKMKAKTVVSQFIVSGTVLDESKKAVREATVVFTTGGNGPSAGVPYSSVGLSEVSYKVRADSAGKYSLKLPQGTYTAMASAPGYITVFFDGKTDVLTANKIILSRDTAGISFVVKKISSVSTGRISGTIADLATKKGLKSKVIAYRDLSVKSYVDGSASYMIETDSVGNYAFANLPPGNYIIFALPSGYFTPTFYSTSGPTTSWERATKISISGNTVTAIDIFVSPLVKTMAGYANIICTVAINGSSVGGTEAASIGGVIVYAQSGPDEVAGYGITDEHGNFQIQELAPGTYTLTICKVNFVSLGTPSVDAVYGSTDKGGVQAAIVSLVIVPVGVTAARSEAGPSTEFVLEQNYPNPFNPSTEINFRVSFAGHVNLKVFDIRGREVATLVNDIRQPGMYSVRWDAAGMASGVYLYLLSASETSGSATKSHIETKKMTLLR